MFNPIHQHLLIKATFDSSILIADRLTNLEYVYREDLGEDFLMEIVAALGMKPVTDARCAYIADLGNEGITGSINLATSHVAFHVWDTDRLLMMDVYSCKSFDTKKALDVVKDYFTGLELEYAMVINRDTGVVESGK